MSIFDYWGDMDGMVKCPDCNRFFTEPEDESKCIFICPHCQYAWVARRSDVNTK